ncbi:MAG TPA: signal peptidase I [Minicystis sp.]|nr:signal peptidase I [Minicystis sp.]
MPEPTTQVLSIDASAVEVTAQPGDAIEAGRSAEHAARAWERLVAMLRFALRVVPVLLVLTLARSTLADQYHVPTASMWPTIEPGDRIFVSKAAYGVRLPFTDTLLTGGDAPAVGEVIVFADPRGGPIPLVKRVVAVAGQTVRLFGGTLYVDGKPQRLERLPDGHVVEHLGAHVHEAGSRDFEDFGPAVVPAGSVFVMGDNRAVSLDSRVFGPVPLHLLRGRVVGTVFRYEDEVLDTSRFLRPIE